MAIIGSIVTVLIGIALLLYGCSLMLLNQAFRTYRNVPLTWKLSPVLGAVLIVLPFVL